MIPTLYIYLKTLRLFLQQSRCLNHFQETFRQRNFNRSKDKVIPPSSCQSQREQPQAMND